ncbi:MAG: hypothetical protein A2V88_13660 [Elusimicrobia bacterium RBG_16_66_12]|nr:MAG: hypothetical protein A2V88_13660 [Elusimicrobia bacterium RBG_16_66_12]
MSAPSCTGRSTHAAAILCALYALGTLSLVSAPRRGAGVALVALGAAWLALYRNVSDAMLGGVRLPGMFAGSCGLWGETPGDIVRAVLAHPDRLIRHLISPTPIRYLLLLLAPLLGVLAFGSAIIRVMLPQLTNVLLASLGGGR